MYSLLILNDKAIPVTSPMARRSDGVTDEETPSRARLAGQYRWRHWRGSSAKCTGEINCLYILRHCLINVKILQRARSWDLTNIRELLNEVSDKSLRSQDDTQSRMVRCESQMSSKA